MHRHESTKFENRSLVIMLAAICVSLLAVTPSWSQTVSAAETNNPDSSQMLMPPPVSAIGFPMKTGGEERSNYIGGNLAFDAGYVTNLYPGTGTTTINDALYLVEPSFSLDHSTDLTHETLVYSPVFTFYDPNSSLNTVNHNATLAFTRRLSPHINLMIGDSFTKTSDTWSQPLSGGPVSGGLPVASPAILVPFASQLSNRAYAQLGWQITRNGMVGFGGASDLLKFSADPEAEGLYNSNAREGSAFYTYRLTQSQYIGATFGYSDIAGKSVFKANTPNALTLDSTNYLGFYTAYLQPSISFSVGGGIQHYKLGQDGANPAEGSAPSALANLGWQRLHTSFAVSYSRMVTDGEGLIGAYSSNSLNLSGRWQFSRSWTANLSGDYADYGRVAQLSPTSFPGGHTISGTVSANRTFGEHLSLSLQYERLRQDYSGIRALSFDPDSSNASGTISYRFSKPLGR